MSFTGPNKKKFTWKKIEGGLTVEVKSYPTDLLRWLKGILSQLYQDGAKNKAPIAKFTKQKRVTDTTTTPPVTYMSPAKIVLDERGLGMCDLVVITFCLTEKGRRAKDDATFLGNASLGNVTAVPYISFKGSLRS